MRSPRHILIALLLLVLLAACSPAATEAPPATDSPAAADAVSQVVDLPANISVTEAHNVLASNPDVILLDVRTDEEWVQDGHATSARLIPLDQLASRVNELDSDATVLVICRSGNRSQQGAEILRQAGFSHVSSIDGGTRQWASAGYEITCEQASCTFAQ